MTCTYPSCRQAALYTPVVAIPTIRTVGMIQPVLSPHVGNKQLMDKMGLDMATTIRLYEAEVEDYKRHCNDLSTTPDPTYLIGTEVCQQHRNTYRFFDWFSQRDWESMCEGARVHGVVLDIQGVRVQFKPVGWEPSGGYMEVER